MQIMNEPVGISKRARRAGTRSCVGCGARVEERRELIRIVRVPDADDGFGVAVDLRGTAPGRGAWVHARQSCVQSAARKGLPRAAKAKVRVDYQTLAAQIAAQADRRASALVGSAWRARRLAAGADAVRAATTTGQPLLLVARDAAAAAKLSQVKQAQEDGRAVAWGTKSQLGALLGRGEVGVVAIEDDGIAEALRHAISLSVSFATTGSVGSAAPEAAKQVH